MGSDTYRSAIIRLQKDFASLQSDLVKQEDLAAKARAEAAKKRKAAIDTKSIPTMRSNLRSAESEDKKVVAAEKRIGDLRSKMAATSDRQHRAENNLASALKSERAAADRVEDARKRKEKADRNTRDREDARRHQTERDHAREISRLSSVTVRHVLEREPEPEKLRVLYLTSSPEVGDPLRVDAEVNNVLKALRGAKCKYPCPPAMSARVAIPEKSYASTTGGAAPTLSSDIQLLKIRASSSRSTSHSNASNPCVLAQAVSPVITLCFIFAKTL
jgi:hypothetical protein